MISLWGVDHGEVSKTYSPVHGWVPLSKVPKPAQKGFLRAQAVYRKDFARTYDKPHHPYDPIEIRNNAAHKMDKYVNRKYGHDLPATRPSARTQKQSGWSDHTLIANSNKQWKRHVR